MNILIIVLCTVWVGLGIYNGVQKVRFNKSINELNKSTSNWSNITSKNNIGFKN